MKYLLSSILGIVTGVLTTVIQLFYPYYMFYQNRRAAGYSWPMAFIATCIFGHVFAFVNLCFTGFGVINGISNILWGMKTGWKNGLFNALNLPFRFLIHARFESKLPYRTYISSCEDGSPRSNLSNLLVHLWRVSFTSFTADSLGNLPYCEEAFLHLANDIQEARNLITSVNMDYFNIRHVINSNRLSQDYDQWEVKYHKATRDLIKLGIIARRLTRYALTHSTSGFKISADSINNAYNRLQESLPQCKQYFIFPNRSLYQRISSLPDNKTLSLTPAEISHYEELIKNQLSEDERTREEAKLRDYKECMQCPLTLEDVEDPITVVTPISKNKFHYQIYERKAFVQWITVWKNKPEELTEPRTKYPLKELKIREGFPEVIVHFIEHVRQVIQSYLNDQKHSLENKKSAVPPALIDQKTQRELRLAWLAHKFKKTEVSKNLDLPRQSL